MNKIMTVKEILENPEVSEFIQSNPDIKINMERAAEILKDEPNTIPAMLSVAQALIEQKINIFFSYKMRQDEMTAKLVVDQLLSSSAGKLNITYAGIFEKDPGGKWNKKICEAIKKAHWFILLLPDPSVEWDWCLYETGMFSRGVLTDKLNRIICLHHPDQHLPPQIQEFQSVRAEQETLEGFLEMIFINNDPLPGMNPINPFLKNNIPQIAANIKKAILPPHRKLEHKYLQRRIRIRVDKPEEIKQPDDLAEAKIDEIDDRTCNIFGIECKVNTWKELVARVIQTKSNNRWISEICNTIHQAALGFTIDPIQATFEGFPPGEIWRPMLSGMYKKENDSIDSFEILFVEEIGVGTTRHIPDPILALMTILKMTYRFRWEIIERFKGGIKKEEVTEFENILEKMEQEAQSRGLIDPEELCKNFSDSEVKEIMKMFKRWNEVRNKAGKGELDCAIENQDTTKIKNILSEMSGINQKFIELATNRFEKLSKLPYK